MGYSDLLLIEYTRNDGVWLPRVGHKIYCSYHLSLSWITPLWSILFGCYNSQAALWRSPCGEELRSPANSQRGTKTSCQEHMSEPSWKQNLQPQSSLHMTATLSNILSLRQNPPAKLSCSLSHRNYEIIHVYYLKPLPFGIIC